METVDRSTSDFPSKYSTLKAKAASSSETSGASFYIQRYNSEDATEGVLRLRRPPKIL